MSERKQKALVVLFIVMLPPLAWLGFWIDALWIRWVMGGAG